MLKLLAHRVAISVVLLLAVAFVMFLLVDLTPQDPARRIAGVDAPAEVLEQVRERLGLEDPLLTRYARWVGSAVGGDLGASLISDEPVTSALARALPVTLSLIVVSLMFSTVVGLGLGILGAMRPNGVVDRSVTVASSVAIAIPNFWFGIMLVLLFSVKLGWLPAVGYHSAAEGYGEWFRHLILPAAALSALGGAEMTRHVRNSLAEALGSQYVLAARARGIPNRTIVLKHALKNAAGPVTTITGFRVAQLIGGTVFVEFVFAYRGLGSLAVDAVSQGDLPVVLGITVIALLAVVAMNLLVDVSYGYFNPRVRRS